MPKKILKSKNKKVNKMTNDGLVEINQTQGTSENISSRIKDIQINKQNISNNIKPSRELPKNAKRQHYKTPSSKNAKSNVNAVDKDILGDDISNKYLNNYSDNSKEITLTDMASPYNETKTVDSFSQKHNANKNEFIHKSEKNDSTNMSHSKPLPNSLDNTDHIETPIVNDVSTDNKAKPNLKFKNSDNSTISKVLIKNKKNSKYNSQKNNLRLKNSNNIINNQSTKKLHSNNFNEPLNNISTKGTKTNLSSQKDITKDKKSKSKKLYTNKKTDFIKKNIETDSIISPIDFRTNNNFDNKSFKSEEKESPINTKKQPTLKFSKNNDTSKNNDISKNITTTKSSILKNNSEIMNTNNLLSQVPENLNVEAKTPLKTKIDKEISKLEKISTKSKINLDKAKNKMPKKTVIKKTRIFNEETKKGKPKFTFEKELKHMPQESFVKGNISKATFLATSHVHNKIHQVEKDNVGVESAHKTQKVAENSIRGTTQIIKNRKLTQHRRITKLKTKVTNVNSKLLYMKTLKDNPSLAKANPLKKFIQKQKIKRNYAKAYRTTKNTAIVAKEAAVTTFKVASILKNLIIKNKTVIMWVAIILLVLGVFSSIVSTGTMMVTQGVSYYFSTCYLADDKEITLSDQYYSELESDLQLKINDIKNQYTGYDEYRYNIGDISHSPFELLAYLTTLYQDFNFSSIKEKIQMLFNEQYNLTITPSVEVRYRTETSTDSDGNETSTEVPYDWHVLTISLTVTPMRDIAANNMTDDELQAYDGYVKSTGNRQYFTTPLNFDWIAYISTPYGFYFDSETGEKKQSKGVNLDIPQAVEVLSMEDGTVTSVSQNSNYGNYIIIDNDKGWRSLYGNMGSISVISGQEIKSGDTIGETSSHLYLEIQNNGTYLNPCFFVDRGDGYINGVPNGGGNYTVPPEAYDDATFATLMEEAQKYIGYPYVWGGSTPQTSFDCSGFVCWSYTQSGVHNIPRTTAQGIYNECTPISQDEAKPGDLVFFTGTYSTSTPVTHIGIYVGNGMMLAAGNPIGYANINSTYWQQHFYSFGRLN